ncbi:hypothetical protein F4680DRAFT_442343 [Xylaria scruposa]|nr:hypothetical protein F4680DRAFT_442343 [Xylaria scruposa]
MTRSGTWSPSATERGTLSGENDTQDSQEKLLFLLREHGIGLVYPQGENKRPPQHFGNASRHAPVHHRAHVDADADADADTAVVASSSFTSSMKRSGQRLHKPRSPVPVTRSTPIPARPDSRNAPPWDKPISSQTRGHVPSRPLLSGAPLKKEKTKTMSSESPTQPNEGRSYEQYTQQGLQPSSPPDSSDEEVLPTLHEGDTGYVDFKLPYDLPDTMPFEPDTPLIGDDEYDSLRDPSQFAPETPTTLPKPFLASGHEQVMPASELFNQTQPTSGLRKASPTSSRPSPNVFGDDVISPTQPESSPLKNRSLGIGVLSTSLDAVQRSSQPPAGRTSRSPSPTDPSGAAEDRDEDEIDETPLPTLGSRKARGVPEPIAEYRPYRKQVLSSKATRSSSQHSLDSDFDRDDAELRHQRARWNKAKASRSFPDIRLPLPGSNRAKVEVPSTSRAEHPRDFVRTGMAQRHEELDTTDHHGSQETVGDSQDMIAEQKSTNETATLVLPARDHNKSLREDFDRPLSVPIENMEDKEVIPETSPVPTFAEPPRLIGDLMRENSCASSGLLTLSYPTPSAAATCIDPSSSLNMPTQAEREVSAPTVIDKRDTGPVAAASSSPSVVPASSQQSTKRRSSRLNNTTTPSSTAPPPLPQSDPGTPSSTLTVLSTTPAISSSVTPNTEDDHDAEPSDDTVSVPSPTAERGRRRRRLAPSLPNPSPSLTRSKTHRRPQPTIRKGTRQSSRHSSLSLDELDKSPYVSSSEDFRTITRKSPRKSTTLREFQTKSRIFEGMVFAVSLQERQQPQRAKNKSLSKGSLEEMIRQEGGTVLDDGFSALFEFDTLQPNTKASSTPVLSSTLNLLDSGTGFAALIADGHSRKVKYMQALALGIPCLAPKWVTTCVSKKEIVDWSSYLLCAGSSTLLGDAIRSRNLQPYDASTARLVQIISQRPKLLNESKILLMMKKTKNEEKRLPYVFLAQVLGASLVRVHSIEEARATLREAESGNNAFDWVYVDDHLQDVKSALFGSTSNEGNSKKRKRTSTGADVGDQPPKRIRTLNDELVVQSLILGRLIEEDEMES